MSVDCDDDDLAALVGPAGCGTSALTEPLELIFRTAEKTERGSSFALGSVPSSEILLWQDYEHNDAAVKFTDMLSLLVGESMELRAPGQLNTKFRNKAPCSTAAVCLCNASGAAPAPRRP